MTATRLLRCATRRTVEGRQDDDPAGTSETSPPTQGHWSLHNFGSNRSAGNGSETQRTRRLNSRLLSVPQTVKVMFPEEDSGEQVVRLPSDLGLADATFLHHREV